MTLLNDPLFKAALDAAFPRVILFADASPVRLISYNASAAALLKGEVVPTPGLHDFVPSISAIRSEDLVASIRGP